MGCLDHQTYSREGYGSLGLVVGITPHVRSHKNVICKGSHNPRSRGPTPPLNHPLGWSSKYLVILGERFGAQDDGNFRSWMMSYLEPQNPQNDRVVSFVKSENKKTNPDTPCWQCMVYLPTLYHLNYTVLWVNWLNYILCKVTTISGWPMFHWTMIMAAPKIIERLLVLQESIRLETDDTQRDFGWCKECITPKIHSAKIRCETG